MRNPDGERGVASVELAIVGPALLLLFALVIFAGRVALAGQAVQSAAAEAARQASIARSQGDAGPAARAAAERTLAQDGLACTATSIQVNTAGFHAPVGTPAQVTARIDCRVSMADLAFPGVPGSRVVSGEATSAIDTYRERADR